MKCSMHNVQCLEHVTRRHYAVRAAGSSYPLERPLSYDRVCVIDSIMCGRHIWLAHSCFCFPLGSCLA